MQKGIWSFPLHWQCFQRSFLVFVPGVKKDIKYFEDTLTFQVHP